MSNRGALAATGVVLALLVLATPASATTFCVPGFFDACPNNGSNLVRSDLSAAMSDEGSDGEADKVVINAGTFTAPESIVATGTDPLEVTGAGREKTFLTSSSTGNIFLLRTDDRPGTKMSDLTLVVPASFPDAGGNGSAAQIEDAVLTRVDVEIRNSESDGFASLIGKNVIVDSHVYAAEGSKVDWAFRTNYAGIPGKTTIVGAVVDQPTYGFVASKEKTLLDVRLSQVNGPTAAAVWAGAGGRVNLENSLVTTYGARAVTVNPEPAKPDLSVVNISSSTLVNIGSAPYPAIAITVPSSSSAGDGQVNMSGSIIHGYEETWNMSVPVGPGFPAASLNVGHSNFPPVASEGSGGTANTGSVTNINQDPLFVSPQDPRLLPDSPSIDSGNPASTLTVDLAGDPRPRDGDGNDSSLPDQGAYEFQPTCETVPALCPDTTPPKISKVTFRFRRGKGGAIRLKLSEEAKLKVTLSPKPRKKRKVVKLSRNAAAGHQKLKLGKKKLKPGRYRMVIIATDQSGNKSKKTRSVRAKG